MAYYEDLSPYNYHHYCEKELNIGWLQKGQPFSVGEVPHGFLEKLKLFAEKPFPVFYTSGWHQCDLCDDKNAQGSCELRIVGSGSSISQDVTDNTVYACPELIIHYIEKHNYLPPQEFIDAVLMCRENMVSPGQDKYTNIVYRVIPGYWEQRKPDINDEDYEEKMRIIMTDNLSREVDAKIAKDILDGSSDFKKFIEAYNQVMPSVYGFRKS